MTMNRVALSRRTDTELAGALVETEVAGARALLDPMGGLLLPELDMLVVSDLHLEKGSAFARRGMLLPPYDTLATLTLLSRLICGMIRRSSSASAIPSTTVSGPP